MMLRRNYQESAPEIPSRLADPSMQEYELLLQFDLKREKEKNLILQERLKNKEIFIQQMKNYQQELTSAYGQCKNQLIIAQQKIQYLQNVQFRQYTEQIADLKHMLMLKTQQSKRNSVGREDRHFASGNSKVIKNKSERGFSFKNSERRQSKTSSNYATHRQRSVGDRFQSEVGKQLKKSAKFIYHFLQMSECYVSDIKSEAKLTKKLKKSWKWIKEVVKDWDHLTQNNKGVQSVRKELAIILKADKDADWTYLLDLVKSDWAKNDI